MSIRKFAGAGFGLALSLVFAASVMASTIGPNNISNAGPGWNSPIYHASSTTFSIQYCTSSDTSLVFDWMHHWPIIPSTGTQEKSLTCANTSTWRSAAWSGGSADYSVEYVQSNPATVTLTYKIVY
jgi:hypothetical protein